jgi:hypothetical protein
MNSLAMNCPVINSPGAPYLIIFQKYWNALLQIPVQGFSQALICMEGIVCCLQGKLLSILIVLKTFLQCCHIVHIIKYYYVYLYSWLWIANLCIICTLISLVIKTAFDKLSILYASHLRNKCWISYAFCIQSMSEIRIQSSADIRTNPVIKLPF